MKNPTISTQSFPNVYRSELYREFERRAFKNGMIDTPGLLVKNASEKISASTKQEIDLKPSDSLENDILRLASYLRKKGYEENAEKIEQNFVIFKKAESEFYNLKLETPQNFLDAAHDIVDQSDLHFHDINEISKAINQTSEKEPSGKESVASLAKKIMKIAQEPDKTKPFQETIDSWNFYVNGLADKVANINAKDYFTTKGNFNNPFVINCFAELTGSNANKIKNTLSQGYALSALNGGQPLTAPALVQNISKAKEIANSMGVNINWDLIDPNKIANDVAKKSLQENLDFFSKNGLNLGSIGQIYPEDIEKFVNINANKAIEALYVPMNEFLALEPKANAALEEKIKQISADLSKDSNKINMENQLVNSVPDIATVTTLFKTAGTNLLSIFQSKNFQYIYIFEGIEPVNTLVTTASKLVNDCIIKCLQINGNNIADISKINDKLYEAIVATNKLIEENIKGATDQMSVLQKTKSDLDAVPGTQTIKSDSRFKGFLNTMGYTGADAFVKDLQDIIDLSNSKAK
jgi:hypothetical protein